MWAPTSSCPRDLVHPRNLGVSGCFHKLWPCRQFCIPVWVFNSLGHFRDSQVGFQAIDFTAPPHKSVTVLQSQGKKIQINSNESIQSAYVPSPRLMTQSRAVCISHGMFLQVLPDYLKGLFSSVPAHRPTEQQLQQVSKLASLQHRAQDHFYLPSV